MSVARTGHSQTVVLLCQASREETIGLVNKIARIFNLVWRAPYVKEPSHVIKIVQIKPKIDITPNRRFSHLARSTAFWSQIRTSSTDLLPNRAKTRASCPSLVWTVSSETYEVFSVVWVSIEKNCAWNVWLTAITADLLNNQGPSAANITLTA